MLPLRISLYIGLFLRPLEILIVGYLLYRQWVELHRVTPFQRIKWMLFTLFSVNVALYGFSWFIDIVGIFNLLPHDGIVLLAIYLMANTLSALMTSVLLLAIYLAKVQ